MPIARTAARTDAEVRLAAVETEWERIVTDLGAARERVRALRRQRVEALGGKKPDARAARSLDSDLVSARNDVDTLEDLLEDLMPLRAQLTDAVRDEQRAVNAVKTATRELRLAEATLELCALMSRVREIADEHGTGYATPFTRSANDLCRLARSSSWRSHLPAESARKRDTARQVLAAAGR